MSFTFTTTTTNIHHLLVLVWSALLTLASFNINWASANTAGKDFVVSCPWMRESATCTAHVSTSEETAVISIQDDVANTTSSLTVVRDGGKNYELVETDPTMYDHDKPIGKYPVCVFQSNRLFRLVVFTRIALQLFEKCAAIVVLPLTSCGKVYYTATAVANPFFTVFSFHYPNTTVSVDFPKSSGGNDGDDSTDSFSELPCRASALCAPGNKVKFFLEPYKAWHFTLPGSEPTLLNVGITSDQPVFAVSGNRYGWSGTPEASWDIGTTSLKPASTWSKTYVVPIIVPNSLQRFVIHTTTFPLKTTFGEGNVFVKHTLDAIQTTHYEFSHKESALIVTANAAFGLTQVFSSRLEGGQSMGDVSLLNIIPVDKWMRTIFYTSSGLSTMYHVKCVLLVKGTIDDVALPSTLKNDMDFKWQKTKTNGYSVAEFVPKEHVEIKAASSGVKLMLYVVLTPKMPMAVCFAAFPFDSAMMSSSSEGGEFSWLWLIIFILLLILTIAILAVLFIIAKRRLSSGSGGLLSHLSSSYKGRPDSVKQHSKDGEAATATESTGEHDDDDDDEEDEEGKSKSNTERGSHQRKAKGSKQSVQQQKQSVRSTVERTIRGTSIA